MDVSRLLTQPQWDHTSLTPPPKVSMLQTGFEPRAGGGGGGGLATCRGPQEPAAATKLLCSPGLMPTAARAGPPGGPGRWMTDTLLPAAKDSKKPAGPQASKRPTTSGSLGGEPAPGTEVPGPPAPQPSREPSATFSRTFQGGRRLS